MGLWIGIALTIFICFTLMDEIVLGLFISVLSLILAVVVEKKIKNDSDSKKMIDEIKNGPPSEYKRKYNAGKPYDERVYTPSDGRIKSNNKIRMQSTEESRNGKSIMDKAIDSLIVDVDSYDDYEEREQFFTSYGVLDLEKTFVEYAKRTLEEYKQEGIKYYQIESVFDFESCDKCNAMDGKVFLVKDAVIGVNFPPFHKKCRCDTAPCNGHSHAHGGMSRDPITQKSVSVPSMSFNEWRYSYIEQYLKQQEPMMNEIKALVDSETDPKLIRIIVEEKYDEEVDEYLIKKYYEFDKANLEKMTAVANVEKDDNCFKTPQLCGAIKTVHDSYKAVKTTLKFDIFCKKYNLCIETATSLRKEEPEKCGRYCNTIIASLPAYRKNVLDKCFEYETEKVEELKTAKGKLNRYLKMKEEALKAEDIFKGMSEYDVLLKKIDARIEELNKE